MNKYLNLIEEFSEINKKRIDNKADNNNQTEKGKLNIKTNNTIKFAYSEILNLIENNLNNKSNIYSDQKQTIKIPSTMENSIRMKQE